MDLILEFVPRENVRIPHKLSIDIMSLSAERQSVRKHQVLTELYKEAFTVIYLDPVVRSSIKFNHGLSVNQ